MRINKNNFRKRRDTLGLTLGQLSMVCDIAIPDLSNIERSNRQANPSWRERLAMALKISEINLFGG